jgi:hypothetical protein
VSRIADQLNEIKHDINQLKGLIVGWSPASGDGGAALKTALTTAWTAATLPDSVPDDMANSVVKHG